MKVLVVEDEVKAAEFIRKALVAESFAVDWCGRGDEALDRAMVTAYDAIVLDIMLPGRDGLSVLRQLRERGIRRRCCCFQRVVMSANGWMDSMRGR